MPQDIQEIQTQIENKFSEFKDWDARYEYIISLGKTLPAMDDALKTEEHRVTGCQSQVWMHASLNDDQTVHFDVASDALVVRGLLTLLMTVYNNQSAETIVKTEPKFMEAIGMADHLSMTRRNGLASMLKQMKLYATVFMMQQQA